MLQLRIISFCILFNFLFVSKGFQLTHYHHHHQPHHHHHHYVSCAKNNIVSKCSTKLKAGEANTINHENDAFSMSPSHVEDDFTSPLMKVYIEDTDAYGVMYNGNYVRAYERALEIVFNDNDWFVEHVTNHQFKNSPVLGDEFIIVGQKVDDDDHKTWNLEMINAHDKSIIYNTATLTINTSLSLLSSNHPSDTLEEEKEDLTSKQEYPFRVYRDEMVLWNGKDESSSTRRIIPCRNILNLFERSRTDSLGGPDSLRRMETDDEIVWVVSRIDDMKLYNCGCYDDPSSMVVVVSNQMNIKRNGMIVEFHHTLVSSNNNNDNDDDTIVLAKGKITVVALDAQTRRPKRKMPPYIVQMLNK